MTSIIYQYVHVDSVHGGLPASLYQCAATVTLSVTTTVDAVMTGCFRHPCTVLCYQNKIDNCIHDNTLCTEEPAVLLYSTCTRYYPTLMYVCWLWKNPPHACKIASYWLRTMISVCIRRGGRVGNMFCVAYLALVDQWSIQEVSGVTIGCHCCDLPFTDIFILSTRCLQYMHMFCMSPKKSRTGGIFVPRQKAPYVDIVVNPWPWLLCV